MCSMKVALLLCATLTIVQCEFHLTILHTNDMHSRFQETNVQSGPCSKSPCYGGFARLRTAVQHFRAEAKISGRSSIFVNAGDTFQGSVFYTMFKHKVVSELVNMMGFDVMSLGNHEFDDGPAGLAPFIINSTVPIVCSNIDYSREQVLTSQKPHLGKLVPSVVLDVDGVKVGVIGYLTPETKYISALGDVVLLDEVTEITKEAARLKKEGVHILIALGHSGFGTDKKIAEKVPDIDVVVGGHTNTFLYNGNPPSTETSEGPYPTVITQASGRKVLVVQAYAYTKYLGHLELTFDNEGEVTHHEGNPIFMDKAFEKDKAVDAAVLKYEAIVKEKVGTKIAGYTKVYLEGDSNCRLRECNFGNFITDALVYASTKDHYGSNNSWTNTPVAIMNGGSLRASISNNQNPAGAVMTVDLMTTLPFENAIVHLTLKGSVLMAVLEKSVEKFSLQDRPGGFLQYSGIEVMYDLSKPPLKRVYSAKVRCGDCIVPQYHRLKENKDYDILTTTFVAEGGDSYTMLKTLKKRKVLSFTDRSAVEDYMKQFTFVYPEVSGRIRCVDDIPSPSAAGEIAYVCVRVLVLCTVLLRVATNHVLGAEHI